MFSPVKNIIPYFLLCTILVLQGCTQEPQPDGKEKTTIVFKYGRVLGDLEPIKNLIKRFEEENPDIRVKDETLPAETGEQHQFYVINLQGKSSDFDVFALDVIWVQEFAKAGWLRDISHILPPGQRDEFFQGPMRVSTYNNSVYAIPWYIDAGVLYYRKDLLDKHGFSPPKTWYELIQIASEITRNEPGLYGFIWQGKQYEGLVCNVLEYIWGNGGDIIKNGNVAIDSPENQQALTLMRDLIYHYGVTPELVTTTIEDSARHIFGKGKAVFMRNWPYAWNLFERDGSPIKGKVGVSALPSFPGHQSVPTLGGWQLGINKYSRHPEKAERFIRFLTSYEVQKTLSLTVGYKPTLKKLYNDKDLIRAQPFTASLYVVFEQARPRPVTPFYMMISQVMQPEFSAVLSRVKKPEEALKSARNQIEFILSAEE
ncbi:MAG TPA: ABC transporter substrate-binding protein [Thermodesulfobacteriota bacterium]|nr:ABC transporter substrate-binding protein [Thermodesulfobacteriota bacterium]